MKIKFVTTNSAEEAEAMRVDMVNTGYAVLICEKAAVVSVRCSNLTNGTTASGEAIWVVIGKK